MSRKNGGIIGLLNTTASGNAKGIWSLSEVHTARKDNIWPKIPGAQTRDHTQAHLLILPHQILEFLLLTQLHLLLLLA